jgi:hypothetical protein
MKPVLTVLRSRIRVGSSETLEAQTALCPRCNQTVCLMWPEYILHILLQFLLLAASFRCTCLRRRANYSLERSRKSFIFSKDSTASFMIRCGSKKHDLFVAERRKRINAQRAARWHVAGQQCNSAE